MNSPDARTLSTNPKEFTIYDLRFKEKWVRGNDLEQMRRDYQSGDKDKLPHSKSVQIAEDYDLGEWSSICSFFAS